MRWQLVAEWAGFQLVWLASALGAARGHAAPGILASALFVAAMLTAKRWAAAECLTILTSGVVGLMAESALVATGLVRFAAPWPDALLAPAWMVALWMAFGATLATFASLLGKRFVAKACIIGSITGPLAYAAGAKVGAIEIVGSAPLAYLAIALIWAIALPSLLVLRQKSTQ